MKQEQFRFHAWALAGMVMVFVLLAVAAVGRTLRPSWRVGHSRCEIVPFSEWGFGSGFWDGKDPHTHRGVGGRIYGYGFVQQTTNAYP